MLFIRHRINTIDDLRTVPQSMGVELDLRDYAGKIVLQHDAFKGGDIFEDFLKRYKHGLMVLNIKTEGIEEMVLDLVKKYKVSDYFFLDVSFPALIRLVRKGENKIAGRFSEYEPLEQCLALKDKVKWVWVDCFTKLPLDDASYKTLKQHFKLCLVSPELQQHPKEKIAEFKKQLRNFPVDAVCTKYPDLWQS